MRTAVAILIVGGIAAVAALISLVFIMPAVRATETPNPPFVTKAGVPGYKKTIVTISDVRLLADIADTDARKAKGLGVRDNITEEEGMLFPFDTEANHGFWMAGMKFPIDIIWLNKNKTVVHIESSLQPCQSSVWCTSYTPDKSALYVLETTAGFSERHNVIEGTQVQFDVGS